MFRLLLTADSDIEMGVGDASVIIVSNDFYKFMEEQEYGQDIKHLGILFICRDFDINKLIDNFTYWFKQKNLDNFPINTAEFIKEIS